MEPMTLGSPGSPPTSSIVSPYLPGFLMGDPTLAPGQPGSPMKTQRQVHFSPNLQGPISIGLNITPISERKTRPNINNIRHATPGEKAGGPPTVGLFDTLETTIVATSKSDIPSTPLESSCDRNQNESWVTIFGFPPSTGSSVLGQFSQLGHILQHIYPEQGNWVNIQYSSKIEAKRALSYNGRVFGGNIMIGVIPCRNQSVLKDVTNIETPLSTPKSQHSFSRRLTSPTSPYFTSPTHRPRSLIGSNTGDNEVLGTQNAPAKNTSIVSKTMDYFFGW